MGPLIYYKLHSVEVRDHDSRHEEFGTYDQHGEPVMSTVSQLALVPMYRVISRSSGV